ncbi:nucleotidyltransferase domain-containing protein [Stackebrandtia nassauensis]|uniref:cGAS/DncV-like nucleotidyltransferase C-terminal helical domain-containing protein n=1 Tax=Stackebrandtia nassauensis (strain DSM 44728 / CIP 108903 / NRRL B-16338 / NBRC 102104 / LLR-40K-21) TaxID=446470 RepID=D3Q0G6_STANL|nr:nucleotidyltransferase [Stackebrandtia nassauensis]ADD41702.1 conserved hypothetical protein [Stackebrandtia nassauensis DSM 44728]
MTLEQKLSGWTAPSSVTEKEKQDRTERLIKRAMEKHEPLSESKWRVFAKGSYANNTNVKLDSDVDIAVECTDCFYSDGDSGESDDTGPYSGIWTPSKFRTEVQAALEAEFAGRVDCSGSTAFRVNPNSSSVDADVVPCFSYRYYYSPGNFREGTKVFKKDGSSLVNYPKQQLDIGRDKNNRTGHAYKKAVRIMKRVENAMVEEDKYKEVPSYLVECLVYNCPDDVLLRSTWVDTIRGVIAHIYNELGGEEPFDDSLRWCEPNDIKYLFHHSQPWGRNDGRRFARGFADAAWDYLGYEP